MDKTPLYDRHVALGAKFAPFAGWDMPIQYGGILAEHNAVREKVGLFDVSHMGRIMVSGPDASALLDYLSTNRIAGKNPGTATYTVWCHRDGGSVDDCIIYQIDEFHFFVVANASNRAKDLLHLQTEAQRRNCTVDIRDVYANSGIIALQGPAAYPLMTALLPAAQQLKSMHVMTLEYDVFLSRTGYTGAGGYELYGPADRITEWWDRLMDQGRSFGICPAGLGARDTLRLEMGFALYGHELSDSIAPNESVSAWTIKWDKSDFIGKQALEKLEVNPKKRWAYGIRLIDKGIARQGSPIFKNETPIGEVTSGSFSPALGSGIGLILVHTPLQIDEQVEVQVRNHLYHAQIVEIPFVRKLS